MDLIQYLAGTVSFFFLLLVLYAVYRGRLREAYALIWLLVSIGILVLSLSKPLLHFLSDLVGIKTPAFALLSCLLMGMLFLLFQMTIVISRHNEKITRLIEELALLKEKLDRR